MKPITSAVRIIACVLATACGPANALPIATRTDSAGITIVASVPSSDCRLAVNQAPELALGETDVDQAAEGPVFVIPMDVVPFRGGFAISDPLQNSVVLLEGGRFRARLGRRGDGPGEFRSPHTLLAAGDTLWVSDLGSARLTAFLGDSLIAVTTLPKQWIGADVGGQLSDGRVVLGQTHFAIPSGAGEIRRPYNVAVANPLVSTGDLDTLGTFPGEEIITVPNGTTGTMSMRAPYGRSVQIAAWGENVAIGSTDRYEIAVYTPEGNLLQLIRLEGVQEELTAAIRKRAEKSFLEGARLRSNSPLGDQTRAAERILKVRIWPATLPAFRAIRADRLGRLWVQRTRADRTDGEMWDVFGKDGAWKGVLQVSEGSKLMHVDSSFAILLQYDDSDVPHLSQHELDRGRCGA